MSTNHPTNGQSSLQQPPHAVAVVMVPFPAQGHLNQLLHLSRLIAAFDIPVHFVGTTIHNRQARLRLHGWDPLSISNIHFHEFTTPHFPSPPPDPNATIKFPSHLQPSFEASSSQLRQPTAALLAKLSSKTRRLVVIHDSLMGSVVQDFLSLPNAESYTFHSVSAFALFLFFWESMGKPFQNALPQEIVNDIPTLDGCFTSDFTNFIVKQHEYAKYSSGRIYNSCRVIESPFIDLLANDPINQHKKLWALGPFNPVINRNLKPPVLNSVNRNLIPIPSKPAQTVSKWAKLPKRHKCLEWLDKQELNSVIFVSFGSTTTFSNEQINELAIGIEASQQPYIWVLREADKGDVFGNEDKEIALPKGYEERMKERGMVVRDWAPQLEILAHAAVGGFMSHCGWNSCMESISMGVPMAAWPMHSDQPRNAVLVSRVLGVGIVVKEWDRRDEVVTSVAVEGAVRRLMASGEGEEIRRRAAELGGDVRRAVAEGGVTRRELESFIAHITR